MKYLLLLIILTSSLISNSQTVNTPLSPGDTVTLKKNQTVLATIPATQTDSALRAVFQKFQRVTPPPPTGDTLTVVSESKQQGTSTLTHNILDVPAGALIVVSAGFSGSGKNCAVVITPSVNLTKRGDAQLAESGDAEIYVGIAGTAGSYKITTNFGAGFQTSVVYIITGYETTLSGGTAIGTLQTSPNVNIATTKANSLLVAVSADFNGRDGSGRIYRDNAVEKYYFRASNKEGTNYHYIKQATTIKQYTTGLSSPTNMAAGTVVFEVKAKSGTTVIDTESPSAPSLTVTGTTTNSASLTWSASTDNIGVIGYDISVDGTIKTTVNGTSYVLTGLKQVTQYSLQVWAKDAAGNTKSSNTVVATTQATPNQSPVARAGNDVSMTLPVNSTTLNGSGSTDPDGTISVYAWTYLSGPSQWTLSDPTKVTTALSGMVAGSYAFRLTVTDNSGAIATDDISVIVNNSVPVDTTSSVKPEGFGANAVGGGNSSTVYRVTNLNASGSGSLANGIGSNRTIVFDVAGTIYGVRLDMIGISYLTIKGETAPSPGIILDNKTSNGGNGPGGDAVSFDGSGTHHCILSNVEVRNAGNDCINVLDGAHDILITNCAAYNAADGNIDIAGGDRVTVQWCIMGPSATGGPGCMLITATNVSAHHNLFSPAKASTPGERAPLVHSNYSPVGNPNADIRWNIIWKFGRDNGTGSGYGTAFAYNATGNAVGNYYYTTGPSAGSATNTDDGYGTGATGKMYAAQNVSGNSGVNANAASNHAEYPSPAINVGAGATACSEAARVRAKAGTKWRNNSSAQTSLLNGMPATLPGCQ